MLDLINCVLSDFTQHPRPILCPDPLTAMYPLILMSNDAWFNISPATIYLTVLRPLTAIAESKHTPK